MSEIGVRAVDRSPYDRLVGVYDLLGHLYSQGGIERAKRAHLAVLRPGMRVLYVGAGTGEECLHAARSGAKVTVVDQSPAMLRRCAERLRRAGQTARFIQADARRFGATEPFDVVVAPFFLNVFERNEVRQLLTKLCESVRRGGSLVSVDFRAPSTRSAFATLQRAYYLPPLTFFFLTAGNAWHELYDYEKIARESQAPLLLTERFVERAYGLPLFETLIWRVS